MTQYMLSVIIGEAELERSTAETQQTYDTVGEFNEELQASGAWVFAGGLHPISTATVVDGTGEEVVTTDGPFQESKEYLGGFWVVEAPDLDAALDLAARGSKACGARVEVRPFDNAD